MSTWSVSDTHLRESVLYCRIANVIKLVRRYSCLQLDNKGESGVKRYSVISPSLLVLLYKTVTILY